MAVMFCNMFNDNFQISHITYPYLLSENSKGYVPPNFELKSEYLYVNVLMSMLIAYKHNSTK